MPSPSLPLGSSGVLFAGSLARWVPCRRTTEQLIQRAPCWRWCFVGVNHTSWYADESRTAWVRPSMVFHIGLQRLTIALYSFAGSDE